MIKLHALGSEDSINSLAEIMTIGDYSEHYIEPCNGQFLFVFESDEIPPLNIREPEYDDITDASELSYRNGMGIISKLLTLEIEVLNEPEEEPINSYFHLNKGICLKHKIWNMSGESEADPEEGEENDWDKQHTMPGIEIEYDLIDLYEPSVFSF